MLSQQKELKHWTPTLELKETRLFANLLFRRGTENVFDNWRSFKKWNDDDVIFEHVHGRGFPNLLVMQGKPWCNSNLCLSWII